MTGPGHARRALDAAMALHAATGHGSSEGPWVPIGAAVRTGIAFVGGVVASGGQASDFTELGESMNFAAHLASQAAAGEVLVTDAVSRVLQDDRLSTDPIGEVRLKGFPEPTPLCIVRAIPAD